MVSIGSGVLERDFPVCGSTTGTICGIMCVYSAWVIPEGTVHEAWDAADSTGLEVGCFPVCSVADGGVVVNDASR